MAAEKRGQIKVFGRIFTLMSHELTFPYAAFMVYLPTKLGDF